MVPLGSSLNRVALWRIERQLRREDPAFAESFRRWSASEKDPPVTGYAGWRRTRWYGPFSLLASAACLLAVGVAYPVPALFLAGLVLACLAATVGVRRAAGKGAVPAEPTPERCADSRPVRPAAQPPRWTP